MASEGFLPGLTYQILDFYINQYSIYILLVCFSVCLGLINIKTAKPIVPNFVVATHMTQGWLLASKGL